VKERIRIKEEMNTQKALQQAASKILTKVALLLETQGEAGLPFLLPALPSETNLNDLVQVCKKSYVYPFPKADHTADAVVFGIDTEKGVLNILLMERGHESEPYFGHWALPGGFVNEDEDLDTAVLRELREETGVQLSYMEQLYTFGDPDRDPRGHVISTAYLGLVRPGDVILKAADDAAKARWFSVTQLPPLAFDHRRIIREGLRRLQIYR